MLTREELRNMAQAENIPSAKLIIPDDGETIQI